MLWTASSRGVIADRVVVEAFVLSESPGISITGLPGSVVKEARDRLRACLQRNGFDCPKNRILVHLSPAGIPKQGGQLDLAMALAILASEGHLGGKELSGLAVLGELSLEGKLSGGAVNLALIELLDRDPEIKTVIVPSINRPECELIGTTKVLLADHLLDVLTWIQGEEDLPRPEKKSPPPTSRLPCTRIRGQKLAKRALQIALAGRHHLLMVGPPGVGKSLLAQQAPSLMPPLNNQEHLELAKTQSAHDGSWDNAGQRPFRSPHHSVSSAALLGGGTGKVVPGEISLAHRGVLFLDELPEFRRDLIEGLREPLEQGEIHIHRLGQAHRLPAQFTLIAAMNPCPCGLCMDRDHRCTCGGGVKRRRYQERLSGPLLDRFDLGIVLQCSKRALGTSDDSDWKETKASIESAWQRQLRRFQSTALASNGSANVEAHATAFRVAEESRVWLEQLAEEKHLSWRRIHKILRVARTIADLRAKDSVTESEISQLDLEEAWALRCPGSIEQFSI